MMITAAISNLWPENFSQFDGRPPLDKEQHTAILENVLKLSKARSHCIFPVL